MLVIKLTRFKKELRAGVYDRFNFTAAVLMDLL